MAVEQSQSRPDGHAQEGPRGQAAGPGVFEGASDLVQELRGVAHDYLTLIALETKRAGQSLIMMVAAGVMMAILLVSAWLGLVAAAVFGMVAAGVPAWLALLIAVVANVLFAAALYAVIHYKRRYLAFPATLRNLRPESSAERQHAAQHPQHHRQAEGVH